MKKYLSIFICFLLLFCAPFMSISDIAKVKDGTILLSDRLDLGDFKKLMVALEDFKGDHLEFIIQSPGGAAYECIAIYNKLEELQEKGVKITTKVYGSAFSAGAILFLVGDERLIHKDASLMYHQVQVPGLPKDYKLPLHIQKELGKLNSWIESKLRDKTLMTEDTIKHYMYKNQENFMSPQAALALGVATQLM